MRIALTMVAAVQMANVATAASIDIAVPATQKNPALVFVTGDLKPGDAETFGAVTASTPQAVIMFNSNGGALADGLAIGAVIRVKGYATSVAGNAVCTSACALAWLAGARRYMQDGARIGFHAAYVDDNGVKTETGMANAVTGAYLNELGLGMAAVQYVTGPAPDQIQWLSFRDALMLGINVHTLEAEAP